MIRLLDDSTIQKIAAGEVIERPASIVKELYENAIDASADDIQLIIRSGGIDEITLIDNGSGIKEDQIELAFERHATSKINNFEDLYSIYTMGFRGEALASVKSAANVEIKSKHEDDELGTCLYYENSKLKNKSKLAMNNGTIISVTDLFENIPVRKKFLKSSRTEANHITDLISKLSLAKENVSTKYVKDDKIIFNISADENHISKVKKIFGKDLADSLIFAEGENEDFKIRAYFTNNTYFRGNRSLQYIYLNSRYIESLDISKQIEGLYRQIIPNGKFPAFQIYIETKADNIDVNIHPNKTKVNLTNQDELILLLKGLISSKLNLNRLKQIEISNEPKKEEKVFADLNNKYRSLLDNYKGLETSKENLDFQKPSNNNEVFRSNDSSEDFEETIEIDFIDSENNSRENLAEENNLAYNFISQDNFITHNNGFEKNSSEEVIKENLSDRQRVGECPKQLIDLSIYSYKTYLFKTYLVFENSNGEDLILVDQHAAHERINYEKILAIYESSEYNSQQLLYPIEIDINSLEKDLLEENQDIFNRYSFDFTIEGNKVLITAVPAIDDINHKYFFMDLIDGIKELDTNSSYMHEKLTQRACKASIKAMDIISETEAYDLVKNLNNTSYPLTCPHGRPTFVRLDKMTLDKEFKRIK